MATLGYHLKMCRKVFGEESRATKFLTEKVKELGLEAETVAPDHQIVALCIALHHRMENPDLFKEVRWIP